MTVTPAWGLTYVVPDDAIAAWGARLIVTQDGHVDMVPDRQGGDGGPHAQELLDLLTERFRPTVLKDTIRELLSTYEMHTREAEDFTLYLDDRICVHANTNASAGYCYVTTWLWPQEPTYVIESYDDGTVLWWNNDDGWTEDEREATVFSHAERYNLSLPIDGTWVERGDA